MDIKELRQNINNVLNEALGNRVDVSEDTFIFMKDELTRAFRKYEAEIRKDQTNKALNEVARGFNLVAEKDEYLDGSPAPSGVWRPDALKVLEIARSHLLSKLKDQSLTNKGEQMKKVYKYGTGDVIPEGAVYLCTKVETDTDIWNDRGDTRTRNKFVWHYFLVEVEE